MSDERIARIEMELNRLENMTRSLRQREKDIQARSRVLRQPSQFQFNSVQNLKRQLDEGLNFYMRPGNVGGINEVVWPFQFNASVDFGANPTISSANVQRTSYQIDEEACFLLMSISIMSGSDGGNVSATERAPLSVLIQDRQSTRFFQSSPMPLQAIGNNSNPAILPTPMFLYPSAFLDIIVAGIPDVGQLFPGDGTLQFSMFGLRTRVENAQKVLSTVFAGQTVG